MTAEGSEKTWDQCRIKLKNLKSQYRYVKDRIPNIDEVDLEDDEVLKQLVAECQGRGISPSNIKHLRYLRRFLRKTTDFASNGHHFKSGASTPLDVTSASARYNQRTPTEQDGNILFWIYSKTEKSDFGAKIQIAGDHLVIDDAESVSPPSTPLSSGVRLIPDSSMVEDSESSSKKRRKLSNSSQYCDFSGLLTGGSFLDGYRFIEKFNRDMMDQFLDYQRRVAASQIRWEQERYRQEQLAIEQWRQESREHEKQMFGIFCGVLSQCNAALNILLKARLDDRDNLRPSKADQSSPASSSLSQDGIKSPPSHHNSGQENNVSS